MSEAEIWLVIFGGMLVTFFTRLSFVMLLPEEWLTHSFERALRFVPPAVLAAIILPELLVSSGELALSLRNHRLLAGMLAAIFAWRFQNTWITIGAGMLGLWLLTAVG